MLRQHFFKVPGLLLRVLSLSLSRAHLSYPILPYLSVQVSFQLSQFALAQTFEAVVTGKADESAAPASAYDEGDAAKQQQQQQRDSDQKQQQIEAEQQSQNVIAELRSVLAVKTSPQERECRKEALFPKYKAKQLVECAGGDDGYTHSQRHLEAVAADQQQQRDEEPPLDYSASKFEKPRGRSDQKRRPPTTSVRRRRKEISDLFPSPPQQPLPARIFNLTAAAASAARKENDSHEEDQGEMRFGFAQSLAAQAVAMAKQRSAMMNASRVAMLGGSDEILGDD